MTAPTAAPRRTNALTVSGPPAVMAQVRDQLSQREDQLVSLLGPTIPVDRFLTVAMHAVNSNPDLLLCTPLSIVESIREAAALRLEPTGLLGDAYLVKYGNKARLMPGFRGLIKLARRSGEIRSIDAQVVYEGDEFDVRLGSESVVIHSPTLGDRGSYRGAYAFAKLTSGELVVEWMNVADIESVRKASKAAGNGPWVTYWGEMARKSVLRRLMKRLPLSIDAERAIQLDAEAEADAPAAIHAPRSAALERVRSKLLGAPDDVAADVAPSEPTPAPVDGDQLDVSDLMDGLDDA